MAGFARIDYGNHERAKERKGENGRTMIHADLPEPILGIPSFLKIITGHCVIEKVELMYGWVDYLLVCVLASSK